MIRIMMATSSEQTTNEFLNQLSSKNNSIAIVKVAKSGKEILNFLETDKNINIIIADYDLLDYKNINILDCVKEREKYQSSFIILADKTTNYLNRCKLIYSVLRRSAPIENLVDKINELVSDRDEERKLVQLKSRIHHEVLSIGYELSYKGTRYLMHAIEYMALNLDKNLDKLETDIYPAVAEICNTTVHNVKCNVNRATNMMYYNCDINKLKEYFYLEEDVRPKTKIIVNTIVNRVLRPPKR